MRIDVKMRIYTKKAGALQLRRLSEVILQISNYFASAAAMSA